ncbi:MAG: hypothetical protein GX256_01150 [Fretibacterium sp.]|nr:hypothetical protein [Fretibacterium sp.]
MKKKALFVALLCVMAVWASGAWAAEGQHTITVTAGTGGTITPSGVIELQDGETKLFRVEADRWNGYRIESVRLDGVDVYDPLSDELFEIMFSVPFVAADRTLEVSFILNLKLDSETFPKSCASWEVLEQLGPDAMGYVPITFSVRFRTSSALLRLPRVFLAGAYRREPEVELYRDGKLISWKVINQNRAMAVGDYEMRVKAKIHAGDLVSRNGGLSRARVSGVWWMQTDELGFLRYAELPETGIPLSEMKGYKPVEDPANSEPPASSGGGGGCNATWPGLTALALFVALVLGRRR